jgi:hypothetical protein
VITDQNAGAFARVETGGFGRLVADGFEAQTVQQSFYDTLRSKKSMGLYRRLPAGRFTLTAQHNGQTFQLVGQSAGIFALQEDGADLEIGQALAQPGVVLSTSSTLDITE